MLFHDTGHKHVFPLIIQAHQYLLPDRPTRCSADCCTDGLARKWDEAEFGPNLDYREYSFMNHSDFPHEIRESLVTVMVCQKDKGYCPEPLAPGTVDVSKVFLQENLASEQIKL